MSRRGYIVIPRGLMDHPALKDSRSPAFCRRAAFAWLLERARWKDGLEDVGGKSLMIPRGSLCCSYRYLADAWGWDSARVQRFIERLKTDTLIDTATKNKRLIINICNYDEITRTGNADIPLTDTPNDTAAIHERYGSDTNKKEGNTGNPATQLPLSEEREVALGFCDSGPPFADMPFHTPIAIVTDAPPAPVLSVTRKAGTTSKPTAATKQRRAKR